MKRLRTQEGSVLVFVTLMIVLLLVIVGMGLDTGQLTYTRSTSQSAVDAAALAAASAIPTGNVTEVQNRAQIFNTTNTFTDSANNSVKSTSVTLMQYSYDPTTKVATMSKAASITTANAARVALETKNPYDGGATNNPINSPLFLTPLFNLIGIGSQKTQNVSVNAVAVNSGLVGLPMAVQENRCGQSGPIKLLQSSSSQGQGNSFNDNSGYTTYWINQTNPGTIKSFLGAANDCSGGIPAFSGTQVCANMNNGVIASVYDDFRNLFVSNPGKCYLIPVASDNAQWQACNPILYFGTWCPDASTPVVQSGNDKYLYGTLTCPTDPTQVDTKLKCFTQVLVRDQLSGM